MRLAGEDAGDPGESRFYLSLQDNLMRLFNAGFVDRVMTTAKMDDNTPIEGKLLSRSIESAQSQIEGQNFEIRKNVLKYDDVLHTEHAQVVLLRAYRAMPKGKCRCYR